MFESGKHGRTKTVKLDRPLKGACDVTKITVVEQGGSTGADEVLR